MVKRESVLPKRCSPTFDKHAVGIAIPSIEVLTRSRAKSLLT